MSNTCVAEIIVYGVGRESIKDLFEDGFDESRHCWDLNDYGPVMRCDAERGDGIKVQDDHIAIRGECESSPPLPLAQQMSADHPLLTFVVTGFELSNCCFQRWRFETGMGVLIDCIQNAYEGEGEEIVYMKDGEQLLDLPDWIAVEEKSNHRESTSSDVSKKGSFDDPRQEVLRIIAEETGGRLGL